MVENAYIEVDNGMGTPLPESILTTTHDDDTTVTFQDIRLPAETIEEKLEQYIKADTDESLKAKIDAMSPEEKEILLSRALSSVKKMMKTEARLTIKADIADAKKAKARKKAKASKKARRKNRK